MKITFLTTLLLCCTWQFAPVQAHDTWVESNTSLIRSGDAIYIDLKLGNHGNHHRDFKLASKIDLEGCTLDVLDPTGKAYDLKSTVIDTG
ncbi:MAG: cobalt ABC transporter substrate-binding protein, partial [Gimesia sp.]|nr:cobalt ABC transporter substrate-binding protein [Gimesia sp.]